MSERLWIRLAVIFAIGVPVFSGCGTAVNYNKKQYVLAPTRSAAPAAGSPEAVLEVRRFMIDSAFSGKGLVYRSGQLQYETDFYNEFLVSPDSMIREAVRNWFAQSGLFARVADPGSYIDPFYALEANVTALYGDLRDPTNPQAVVELRAFLLQVEGSGDPIVVHSKTYSATTGVQAQDPDALVEAFNNGLQKILTNLEADIAARL